MVNNLTNLTGTTNFYEIIVYTNQETSGVMGMGFILVTFMILTMMFLNKHGAERSVLVASFICFLLSISLTAIDLLNPVFILSFAAIFVLDGFWIYFSTR